MTRPGTDGRSAARKPRSSRRSRARRAAMQAVYQWQMTTQPPAEVEQQFREDHTDQQIDFEYFRELLHGVAESHATLDAILVPALDRPLEQLDAVERAILRLGAYELKFRIEVPFRVVINEAVELARCFGAEQSHRYVNAVMDGIAIGLRPHEPRPRSRAGNG